MHHSTYLAPRYRTYLSIFIQRQSARAAIVAIALAASSIFPAAGQTLQPPETEFYLQTMHEDPSHFFGLIDSKNAANAVTGFAQLNPLRDPNNPNTVGSPKSQWWKDILLTGNSETVKLKNDETGQCIGELDNVVVATMMSCDDGKTIWHRTPHGDGIIYRRPYDVGYVLGIDVVDGDCLSMEDEYPGLVVIFSCRNVDNVPKLMVWSRTTAPIGVVAGGLTTTSPPPIPPVKPTACKVVGAAVCGQVQFSCDPLSASDTIAVPSGMIGVKVTSVQANIGMVNATYLNAGQARVAICATKPGASACSTPLGVSFGRDTMRGSAAATARDALSDRPGNLQGELRAVRVLYCGALNGTRFRAHYSAPKAGVMWMARSPRVVISTSKLIARPS